MGFKKFLGAFVEIDETPKPADKKLDPTKPLKGQVTTSVNEAVHYSPPQTDFNLPTSLQPSTEFDQRFEDILAQENNANMPGTDYYEFIQAKKNMSSIPVEADRYTTTYNILKTTGLTKQILVDTGGKYIAKIDGELAQFNNAYNAQYSQKVDSVQADIDAKLKQMQELSTKINDLNNDVQKLKSAVSTDQLTLTTKKAQFEASANKYKQQIADEINKINIYITE